MEGKWKGIDIQAGLKAFLASLLFFLFSGVVSTTIPNPWFVRMIPLNGLDYFFWIVTSVLLLPIAYAYFSKDVCKACELSASGGVVGGVVAFSCPICSKLLVLLIGVSGALAFDAYRPLVGAVSLGLLLYALFLIYFKR